MLLRRAYPTERWRAAVFFAVVCLHLLVGLLIFTASRISFPKLRSEQDTPLILLQFFGPKHPSSETQSPKAILKGKQEEPEIPFQSTARGQASVVAPAPNKAITLPYVDWGAEVEAVRNQRLDSKEMESRMKNLAGPSDAQLEWSRNNVPLVHDHHELGDTKRVEGGEVITWENDKCYWTTKGITTFGMPQTLRVCKDPPKPDTELFKEMRKKLDERETSRSP